MSKQPVAPDEASSTVGSEKKPLLPSHPIIGGTSSKSDSFRISDYDPPSSDAAVASTNEDTILTSWWRRVTNSGRNFSAERTASEKSVASQNPAVPAPVDSGDVIEELQKRSTISRNPDLLPPLPSPRPAKTASGRVGLQSVKLIPVENPKAAEKKTEAVTGEESRPTEKSKETETAEEINPPPAGAETEVKEKTDSGAVVPASALDKSAAREEKTPEKDEKTATKGVPLPVVDNKAPEEAATPIKSDTVESSVVAPVPVPATTTADMNPQKETPKAASRPGQTSETTPAGVGTSPTEKTPEKNPPLVNESAAIEPPVIIEENRATDVKPTADPALPTAAIVPESGAKTTDTGESATEPVPSPPTLKVSKTMPTSSPSRKFLSRIFTFGSSGHNRLEPTETEVKEASVPSTEKTQEAAVVASEQVPAKTSSDKNDAALASVVEPPVAESSGTPSMTTDAEQAAETVPADKITPQRHDRTTSELTSKELDDLKSSLVKDMKEKGIDGKYDKSSKDFDSPLLFLLDLHTFAQTQNTTVEVTRILTAKYGGNSSIVSEFTEATVEKNVERKETAKIVETPNAAVGVVDDAVADTQSMDVYESGLDTAKTNTGGATLKDSDLVETTGTASTEPLIGEKEVAIKEEEDTVGAVTTNTATVATTTSTVTSAVTVEAKEQPAVENPAAQTTVTSEIIEETPAPAIPFRDETARVAIRRGCGFCICLHPDAS